MKTAKNYTGSEADKFNDKYNFVALFTFPDGETTFFNPSTTYEGCFKNATATTTKRIGFEKSTFEVFELE